MALGEAGGRRCRLGTADEIAHAMRFVASRDAAFMTGETLVIDGGWTAFGFYQRRGS